MSTDWSVEQAFKFYKDVFTKRDHEFMERVIENDHVFSFTILYHPGIRPCGAFGDIYITNYFLVQAINNYEYVKEHEHVISVSNDSCYHHNRKLNEANCSTKKYVIGERFGFCEDCYKNFMEIYNEITVFEKNDVKVFKLKNSYTFRCKDIEFSVAAKIKSCDDIIIFAKKDLGCINKYHPKICESHHKINVRDYNIEHFMSYECICSAKIVYFKKENKPFIIHILFHQTILQPFVQLTCLKCKTI